MSDRLEHVRAVQLFDQVNPFRNHSDADIYDYVRSMCRFVQKCRRQHQSPLTYSVFMDQYLLLLKYTVSCTHIPERIQQEINTMETCLHTSVLCATSLSSDESAVVSENDLAYTKQYNEWMKHNVT